MNDYIKNPKTALLSIKGILKRYDEYGKYLNYPGEWGERAFRGWLVFELFHIFLGWHIERIILGEKYDTLFINEEIKPVIYLETKRPKRGLAEYEEFIQRSSSYPTLRIGVLTDGYEWLQKDYLRSKESKITIDDSITVWKIFLERLHILNFVYGV